MHGELLRCAFYSRLQLQRVTGGRLQEQAAARAEAARLIMMAVTAEESRTAAEARRAAVMKQAARMVVALDSTQMRGAFVAWKMHTAAMEDRRAMLAKSAARMAVAIDADVGRAVFVSWKALMKETAEEIQRARAAEESRRAEEAHKAVLLKRANRMAQAFDATQLRSYFGEWSMYVKAEVMRRGMVTKAAARMAAAFDATQLRGVFVAWKTYTQDERAHLREAEAARKSEEERRAMYLKSAELMAAGSTTKLMREVFLAWDEHVKQVRFQRLNQPPAPHSRKAV